MNSVPSEVKSHICTFLPINLVPTAALLNSDFLVAVKDSRHWNSRADWPPKSVIQSLLKNKRSTLLRVVPTAHVCAAPPYDVNLSSYNMLRDSKQKYKFVTTMVGASAKFVGGHALLRSACSNELTPKHIADAPPPALRHDSLEMRGICLSGDVSQAEVKGGKGKIHFDLHFNLSQRVGNGAPLSPFAQQSVFGRTSIYLILYDVTSRDSLCSSVQTDLPLALAGTQSQL
eukprot:PhF_6_TR5141/c0_g1_i1/m.7331